MIVQDLEIRPNIYYTPDEAAGLLRVSRRSVLKLLESGLARGLKIGRHWRVLGSDLLLMSQTEEPIDAQLTRSLMSLSEPAFMNVWDNDADSVYDDL